MLRKTQNVITHIVQPGTEGEGRAHNAADIAFDDTNAAVEAVNVQAAIADLAARIAALEAN